MIVFTMKMNQPLYYSFLLVLLFHGGVLGLALLVPAKSQSIEWVLPTIQGVIVAAQPPPALPAELPPHMPEPKSQPISQPVTKTLTPRAPPSERAIQQKAEPSAVGQVEQKAIEPSVAQSSELLVLPHVDASQINNVAPVYPTISRRLREEGVVILEVLVLADGTVGELRVKQSSGYARLDEAATRAVKNWHFVPAKRGNEAIDFWYQLPIEFSLNK